MCFRHLFARIKMDIIVMFDVFLIWLIHKVFQMLMEYCMSLSLSFK